MKLWKDLNFKTKWGELLIKRHCQLNKYKHCKTWIYIHDCQLEVKLWKGLNFKTKQGGSIKRYDQFKMNVNIKEKDKEKGWKTYDNDK